MSERAPTEEDALKFGFLRKRSSAAAQQDTNVFAPAGSIAGSAVGPGLDDEEYVMSHRRRGYAVVFNHTFFKDGQTPRAGATADVRALDTTLTKLGFNVIVHTNLNKKGVVEKLNEVAQLDHTDSDCLVIVVMTHGDAKELCAYDQSYDVSKLWESLKGEKSPTLIAKPKLFFIQACRGSAVDEGVTVMVPRARTLTDGGSKAYYVIPMYADFLIANATFDGHYAWRNSDSGSWFIQALCTELARNDGSLEICDILTRVNRRVAITQASYVPGKPELHMKKQMPNFLSTLTRKLYFRPKH